MIYKKLDYLFFILRKLMYHYIDGFYERKEMQNV